MKFRHLHGEMMDRDDLPKPMLHQAFKGLRRLHRLSNACVGISKKIRALLPLHNQKEISILEFGCGDGGLLACVLAQLRRCQINAHGCGVDFNKNAIALACARADNNLEFISADACTFKSAKKFDVGFTSLFLHHLTSTQATTALQNMARQCRFGFVCFDLQRSFSAWLTTWIACRAVTRSKVVHNDGPRSIEAAFKCEEIFALTSELNLGRVSIQSAFPLGFYLVSQAIVE